MRRDVQCRSVPRVLCLLALLWTAWPVAAGDGAFDIALTSRVILPHLLHMYNASEPNSAAAAWKGAVGRAATTGACQSPDAVAVVLDAGFGNLVLAVADASRQLRVVAWAPSNSEGLAPRLEVSVRHAGFSRRVTVVRSAAEALQAMGPGPRACAVILDWLPRAAGVSRVHVAALADLVVAGAIDARTRVLPAAARVHVAALRCPHLARLTAVSEAATLGVDMRAAFPRGHLPGAAFWAGERPTSAAEVGCGAAKRWEAPSTATMHFAAAAVAAARGRPMPAVSLTVPVPLGERVDALSVWHDVVLDESAEITAPLTGPSEASAAGPLRRAAVAPSDVASGLYSDVLIPLPDNDDDDGGGRRRGPQTPVVGGPLAVDVTFSSGFVLHAAPRSHSATDRPSSGAPFAVWHISMLNDLRRNEAYGAAIAAAVAAHSVVAPPVVIELGAGAGLLAVLAARAGAGAVYAVEASEDMQRRLRATIAANGVGGAVHVLPCHSTEVRVATGDTAALSVSARGDAAALQPQLLPRRADILVHEIFDFSVTGEGVLPSVADALRRLMRRRPARGSAALPPTVVPARLVVYAVAVESEELGALHDVGAFTRAGSDLRHVEGLSRLPLHASAVPVDLGALDHTSLTPAKPLWSVDFGSLAELDALLGAPLGAAFGPPVSLPVVRRGRIDALVSWFVLDFGGSGARSGGDASSPEESPPSFPSYSTGPGEMHEAALHWFQAAEVPLWGDAAVRGPFVVPGDIVVLQPLVEAGAGGFAGLRSRARVQRRAAPSR